MNQTPRLPISFTNPTLLSYVRESKKITTKNKRRVMQTNKVGCLVGTLNEEDQIVIGWSACNRKAGDEFSRIRGIEVALSAATATINKDEIEAMPHRIRKAMPQFIERCERYFRRPVNRE